MDIPLVWIDEYTAQVHIVLYCLLTISRAITPHFQFQGSTSHGIWNFTAFSESELEMEFIIPEKYKNIPFSFFNRIKLSEFYTCLYDNSRKGILYPCQSL